MYKKIVVTLDGSELAETAVAHAETIARGCEQPQIVLLRVIEPVKIPYGESVPGLSVMQLSELEKDESAKAEKYLNGVAARLSAGGAKVSGKIMEGLAAETIVDYINESRADLVIMATHGRSGISRWIWGSVADRILHSVCVPVLMVRVTGCGTLYKRK